MPLFPSDFKKFKHVKSDKDTTTLQHPKGHQIVIAHNALSKPMRAQLEALSKVSTDAQTPLQADQKRSQKMADGGLAKSGALGTGPKVKAEVEEAKAPKPDYTKREDIPSADSPQQKSAQDKFDAYMKQHPAPKEPGEGMAQGGVIHKTPSMGEGLAYGGQAEKMAPRELYDIGMADGGQAEAATFMPQAESEAKAKGGKLKNNPNNPFVETKKYAEGTPDEPVSQDETPTAPVPMPEDMQQMVDAARAREQDQSQPQVTAEGNTEYLKGLSNQELQKLVDNKSLSPEDADAIRLMHAEDPFNLEAMGRVQKANTPGFGIPNAAPPQLSNVNPNYTPPAAQVPQQTPQTQAPTQAGQPPQDQAQQDQTQAQADTNPLTANANMLNRARELQIQGAQEGYEALKGKSADELAALNKSINAQTIAQAHFKRQYRDLEQERQNLMHDVQAGYVDPEKFWDNHSKIATGIGIILAGFNPTSNPNAAINFLKFQMEQNLNAQRENLSAKNNLLAHNLQQFGNLRDATEMTRIQQADILNHQLMKAAATAASPLAKASLLDAVGKLNAEYAPRMMDMAWKRSMMGLAASGQTDAFEHMIAQTNVMNPEMGKQMQEHYVKGVGQNFTTGGPSIPIDARNEISGKKEFDTLAREYIAFAKQHAANWRNLNPTERAAISARGAAMAADLQGAYRRASKGGVFKEGEQSFIESIIPSNPTQWGGSFRTIPKVEAIMHNNNIGYRQLLQQYALPEQDLEKAQKSSQAPQYKTVGGKTYMRGPHGEAIEVKQSNPTK